MTRLSCFCHYERSEVIQKQVLLVRRLLLSFHSIAMTCSGVSSRTQCDVLGFCHYERSEVIKKTSAACKEIASVTTFHRNDKVRGQVTGKSRAMRLPRRVFCTARNDKRRAASFLASNKNRGTKNLRQV